MNGWMDGWMDGWTDNGAWMMHASMNASRVLQWLLEFMNEWWNEQTTNAANARMTEQPVPDVGRHSMVSWKQLSVLIFTVFALPFFKSDLVMSMT
jgi:hypothetical protein